MTDPAKWTPLIQELDRWHAAGRRADLWLRDDDATLPSAALDRLLDQAGAHRIPVTLAVIPEGAGDALAARLADVSMVTVAQHGWSHRNHAGAGEKKAELGPHRPAKQVLADLSQGLERLAGLFPAQFHPVLVPPWNRIAPELVPRLPVIGCSALSVFGAERSGPVPAINTHVDLIDWRGGRGGRDTAPLVAECVARLRTVFDRGGTVGLLTHHLVHDEAAWAFLRDLFRLTAAHGGCRWRSLPDLVADQTGPTG